MSSRVMDEIINSMQGFTPSSEGDGGARAVFSFEESFAAFQGHFPEQKVLPGVCLVQCAMVTLDKATGAWHELKEVLNVKFTNFVGPGDVVECRCNPLVEKGEMLVLVAIIKKADEVVAKITLSVAAVEGLEGQGGT